MHLYLTVRWGNAASPDGPDGQDTLVVVRAASVSEAADLADQVLINLPTTSPQSQRPVEPFCHRIIEIGRDDRDGRVPTVLIGPLIADGPGAWGPHTADCRVWMREDQGEEWRDARDEFSY